MRLFAAALALVLAHPLGNFTVNHYNGLRLHPDRVESTAVVDLAELPTLQAPRPADAGRLCASLAAAQRLTIDGEVVPWQVVSSAHAYEPGQSGLRTSRLTCALVARARVTGEVVLTDGYEQDRIGWREITATASGVRLTRSTVPTTSVSKELRAYPEDLLASPLSQRTATLSVDGASTASSSSTPPGAVGVRRRCPGSWASGWPGWTGPSPGSSAGTR